MYQKIASQAVSKNTYGHEEGGWVGGTACERGNMKGLNAFRALCKRSHGFNFNCVTKTSDEMFVINTLDLLTRNKYVYFKIREYKIDGRS